MRRGSQGLTRRRGAAASLSTASSGEPRRIIAHRQLASQSLWELKGEVLMLEGPPPPRPPQALDGIM